MIMLYRCHQGKKGRISLHDIYKMFGGMDLFIVYDAQIIGKPNAS
jgi:hypothetical protein